MEKLHRPIRSFVLRTGRMTASQKRGLEAWSQYGLSLPSVPSYLDWKAVFRREAPRVLEIGFGMGDTLLQQAGDHPDVDFIGVEVHLPGVGRCLAGAQERGLTNLKVFSEDVIQVLTMCIPDESLDAVWLLFPDPWPKKRHHKRRLVQPSFVELVAKKLKKGGQFIMATDWQPYADHMLATCEACPTLVNANGAGQFARLSARPVTKFEKRGLKLGHEIWELVYQK